MELDRLFNFDLSTIICDYLDVNDLINIAKILDNIPISFSKIKRSVCIHDIDEGKHLIKYFKCIKLIMEKPD